MKKQILLIALGLIFWTSQDGYSQTYLGAKIGGFFGTTSTELVGDFMPIEWKMGTEIGLTAEKMIDQNWSLLSGIQYSTKGFSMSQGTDFSVLGINVPLSARADFNLHYVESPLAIKYTIPLGQLNVYGTMGGVISYASKANINTKADFIVDVNLGSIDINLSDNNINRWNTSATIGAGLEHPIKKGKLFLDVKYNHGLNDLVGTSILDLNVRNKGFSLGLGYAMAF